MIANTSCKIVEFKNLNDTKMKLNFKGKKIDSVDIMRDRSYDGKKFRTSFIVGDEASFDSYNLIYTGTIQSMTEKTVTIKTKYDRCVRLSLEKFAIRNFDFDAVRIAEQNAETMMYI
jgi:hypothetical protein